MLDPGMDKGGQRGVVVGDPQSFQVVQGATYLFRGQPGDCHQLIGRDTLVGVGIDHALGNGQ